MSLVVRDDTQIVVGFTPGLVAGASSFTFDGTAGKPNYIGFDLLLSDVNGFRLYKNIDYTWDPATGTMTLLNGAVFVMKATYLVHLQILVQPVAGNHYSMVNSYFFIRDINIPNTTHPAVLQRLNSMIAKYEPEVLRIVLGDTLYSAFCHESSPRMTELRYGGVYTNAIGNETVWEGLVHDDDQSLIAHYVYYYSESIRAKQSTGTGTKVPKQEGGEESSPADKMIDAWNIFSSEVSSLLAYLWLRKGISGDRIFPEFTTTTYAQAQRITRKNNIFGI